MYTSVQKIIHQEQADNVDVYVLITSRLKQQLMLISQIISVLLKCEETPGKDGGRRGENERGERV